MDSKEFDKIKARFDELKAEQSKIDGAKDSVITTLKESYGINSLAEAKKRLEELQFRQREITTELDGLFSKLTKLGI